MTVFRVTKTTVSGQFANDACFSDWMNSMPKAIARIASVRVEPKIGNEPDRLWYVWSQDADTTMVPKDCDPELISLGGKNGWPTRDEAEAVVDHFLGQAKAVKEQVEKANAAAVDPANIAAGVVNDAAAAAGKAATALSPGVKVALGVGLGLGGVYLLGKLLGGR